ncbi:hypothetical protein LTS10_006793 [Elasticomyces elasticus]|nr:hypothetical protein LTS10_006793 [Elasticomyces elasticus]
MAKPTTFADTIAASVDQFSSDSGFNVSITQDYAYDDTDAVPTIFLDDPESSSLRKRSQRPDECWTWTERYAGASLPSHASYDSAVANIIGYLRGQGSLPAITIAYYVQQISDFCPDESGWIAQAGSLGQTVIIVQPISELPPPYGAQCPA